ncbi:hypothetical protein [Rhizomonospora bruguierae]|uniref:hypothetical protein n=1 Tax=Rhizomonospora bruguierae TaxID=1581705 RepID=UPI001BCEB93A|nr:hypothetical protein [Micromonospora sp. NBRC 107566]
MGVLVTCDGSFSRVSVFEHDNRNDVDNRSLVTWAVHGNPTSEVVRVLLFGQPPDGWQVEGAHDILKIEPLTKLKPRVKYSLSGSSHRKAISVDFTVSDFARIGPDDVLTPTDCDTMKIMPREVFVRRARKSCG